MLVPSQQQHFDAKLFSMWPQVVHHASNVDWKLYQLSCHCRCLRHHTPADCTFFFTISRYPLLFESVSQCSLFFMASRATGHHSPQHHKIMSILIIYTFQNCWPARTAIVSQIIHERLDQLVLQYPLLIRVIVQHLCGLELRATIPNFEHWL